MRLTALRLADDTHMEGPRVRNQENVSAAHAGPSAPRGRQMPGPWPAAVPQALVAMPDGLAVVTRAAPAMKR